ncbi:MULTISPECIES: high frequency lysogenization protein HflD [Marinobacter]|uniref:High frequency lysogenization protein HflD homolog n=1 Tax=Marinobacter xestospongiae TaxID=994319 RepID=A0ABU3VZC7_9GAMM|nr:MULTISPECIES: high frequency lysogenization protein HflD [Marinobacter]MDV2079071.1 high frequency lysogenization protein HflD [Marinobacter xestospongiae]UDL06857.1 high frequency lysogenization protein HflD [Marinobacter sp. CA1]
MSQSRQDQTLALAGVFQCTALVQQIAHSGRCADSSFETCIRSLFATDPNSTLAVYGELKDLREGLATLASVLNDQSKPQDLEILKYALNLIHLESRLNRNRDMLDIIGSRIDQARHTAQHFGYTHGNLVSNLASIYSDTISTLKPRIQVVGDPAILQQDENAARIRALLLAGIRAAVLWRQTGGRRWQLIFTRRKTVHSARLLAEQANRSVYD